MSVMHRILQRLQTWDEPRAVRRVVDPAVVADMCLEESVLVAAHPDDEAICFSALWPQVRRIVFCFEQDPSAPDRAARRRAVLAAHPRRMAVDSLGLADSGCYGLTNWAAPAVTREGMDVGAARARYAAVYRSVVGALTPILQGERNVITHNPWGDYGHEDHVLVYRAVHRLKRRLGFTLWHSNYVSNRSVTLAAQYVHDIWDGAIRRPVDRAANEALMALYQREGCWTWHPKWSFFEDEWYVPDVLRYRRGDTYGRICPLNFVRVY